MANNIDYAKKYLPIVDEIFRQNSLTADLLGGSAVVQEAQNVGEVNIMKVDVQGMGDYDGKYAENDTNLHFETVKYDKQRSAQIKIDRIVNAQTMDKAFAEAINTLMKKHCIPESDSARIANLVQKGKTRKEEDLTTGEEVVAALRACTLAMDNDEVPYEDRILYITPTLYGLIEDMDSYKSKAVLDRFAKKVIVPPSRMYSAIELKAGTAENGFGYRKAEGAKDVNFVCVYRPSVIADTKEWLKYFTPEQNLNSDDHLFQVRNFNLYGYVYENQLASVYSSITTV